MQTKTVMNSIMFIVVVLVLALDPMIFAQKAAEATPQRAPELALTYDYIRSNAPPGGCGCFSLNGAGLTFAYPLRLHDTSIVGRMNGAHAGSIGSANYSLTLLTYGIGVRYDLPRIKHSAFRPYGQALIGFTHAAGSLVAVPNSGITNSDTNFSGSIGGGIDMRLRSRLSLRPIEAEYLTTTFNNGSNNHQNNLHISAGLVFHFCSAKHCDSK